MKRFLFILCLFNMTPAKAEDLEYFRQFFYEVIDVRHDPDFPEYSTIMAGNDFWQTIKTSETTAYGVLNSIKLTEDGKFTLLWAPVLHKWENAQRLMQIQGCQSAEGQWSYRDGSIYIGKYLRLDAHYENGQNLLKAKILDWQLPPEAKGLEFIYAKTDKYVFSEPTEGIPSSGTGVGCWPYPIPFWIPLPEHRPW